MNTSPAASRSVQRAATIDAANGDFTLVLAEDIAGVAIFLSSRAGAFVVGQVIASDGGAVIS